MGITIRQDLWEALYSTFSLIITERDLDNLIHSLREKGLCIESEAQKREDAQKDKLFLTELINDLYQNDFMPGGKAQEMLHAWSGELRDSARLSHPASRLRKTFNKLIGKEHW